MQVCGLVGGELFGQELGIKKFPPFLDGRRVLLLVDGDDLLQSADLVLQGCSRL